MVMKHSIAHKVNRKIFWLAGCVLIVLVCGAAAVLVIKHNDTPVPIGDQAAYDSAKKEATIDNDGVPTETSDGKASNPGTYTPPSSNNGIAIQPSQSAGNVAISVKLAGYSDGDCTLTITNGTKTASRQAKIIYAPSFSTCAGFTVPISDIGTGTWKIALDIVSGGVTTSKSVTYEVQGT